MKLTLAACILLVGTAKLDPTSHCRSMCYYYKEASYGHCTSDCRCDGRRTCDLSKGYPGVCRGKAR